MRRLTKYKPTPNSMFPYKLIDDGANTELDAIHKLGRLEDLEEELDMPLDKAVDLLFKAIKDSEFYDCLTCTNVMHNERGCDGNCSHNKEFSRKEILELLELEEKFSGK